MGIVSVAEGIMALPKMAESSRERRALASEEWEQHRGRCVRSNEDGDGPSSYRRSGRGRRNGGLHFLMIVGAFIPQTAFTLWGSHVFNGEEVKRASGSRYARTQGA